MQFINVTFFTFIVELVFDWSVLWVYTYMTYYVNKIYRVLIINMLNVRDNFQKNIIVRVSFFYRNSFPFK